MSDLGFTIWVFLSQLDQQKKEELFKKLDDDEVLPVGIHLDKGCRCQGLRCIWSKVLQMRIKYMGALLDLWSPQIIYWDWTKTIFCTDIWSHLISHFVCTLSSPAPSPTALHYVGRSDVCDICHHQLYLIALARIFSDGHGALADFRSYDLMSQRYVNKYQMSPLLCYMAQCSLPTLSQF